MNKNEIDNKLHSELESNSDSVELGIKLDDTHEDAKNADNLEVEAEDENLSPYRKLAKKYRINKGIKTKDELLDSDIILSVRNLKQFFFFGSGLHKQKNKAGSYTSHYIQNLTQNRSETQLNMTPKMVKLLEENKGINLCEH